MRDVIPYTDMMDLDLTARTLFIECLTDCGYWYNPWRDCYIAPYVWV
jgi:hypothetical protein